VPVAQLQFKMMCERPPHKGEITILPLREGRAADGGRGSVTRHRELELSNTAESRGDFIDAT
jgi:hypothetical protein